MVLSPELDVGALDKTRRPLKAVAHAPGAIPGGWGELGSPGGRGLGPWELRFNYVKLPGCWDPRLGINVNTVLVKTFVLINNS